MIKTIVIVIILGIILYVLYKAKDIWEDIKSFISQRD